MIKCIIVDDEPLAVQLLTSYVEETDRLELLESFTDPISFMQYIIGCDVDVVFLDIHMPEISGIQVAKIISSRNVKVIFTTADVDYAIKGFELAVVDYLVKPITLSRFQMAIGRLESEEMVSQASKYAKEYIFVKVEHRQQRINLSDIIYMKGMGDYVQIHTNDKKYMTLENLKSFEGRLPTRKFIRIHRSYLISVDRIEFVERNRISINGERLPVGAKYEEKISELVKLS